jgi:hypothetical protein
MSARARNGKLAPVPRYLLHHRHEPDECGGHAIWWTVEASSEGDALRMLPPYIAERTTVVRVSKVDIP